MWEQSDGDHIYGLPGFLGSRSFQGATSTLYLYGPEGVRAFVETALAISGTYLNYELVIEEVSKGELFQTERWRVSCCELEHRLPSFGYRFEEAERPGKLDAAKLEQDKIPKGPWLKTLKKGGVATLPDRTVIDGKSYLEKPVPGRILVFLGDTRPLDRVVHFVRGADVLVHEATFMKAEQKPAEKYAHSTTEEAAEIATKAGVKRLILTHISSRYQGTDMSGFTKEARRKFPNTEVAADFAVYHV